MKIKYSILKQKKNLSNVIYKIIRTNHKTIINELEEFDLSHSETVISNKIDISKVDMNIATLESPTSKIRQNNFNSAHKLESLGVPIKTISRTLGISRNTVKNYLLSDSLQGKQIPYTNNYHFYIEDIKKGCEKHMLRKEIYEEIKNKGFRGGLTAFYEWFKKQFPIYSETSKHFKKTYAGINIDEYKRKNRKCFMSARMLSIYISSETYGVNTDTGELTPDYIIAHEMIENSKILSYLKTIHKTFKDTLRNGIEQDLYSWLNTCANSKYIQISNFARTIKNDMKPVLNAIKYKYTNGLVEGHVNRLKTKKREMYGRAGFELLRRKVCLSKFG